MRATEILRSSSAPNALFESFSTSSAPSISMAAPRGVYAESGGGVRALDEDRERNADSPTDKKYRAEKSPPSRWEFVAALGVFLSFSSALLFIYLTMPAADYDILKLPRTLADLRLLKLNIDRWSVALAQFAFECVSIWILRMNVGAVAENPRLIMAMHLDCAVLNHFPEFYNIICNEINIYEKCKKLDLHKLYCVDIIRDHLGSYARHYPAKFILGYCSTYIFMQTFMIPGTIFMSLLAGALFGVGRGLFLVVFNATAGASSCYFLSKLIGKPIVLWLWPEKLRYFQTEIGRHRDKLLNYMLFLRVTPTLPNLFINLASPIVDIPFYIFFLATVIGLIPASYITVSAGLALGDLKSVKDLYDYKTLAVLFLIGSVLLFPTLRKRKASV
ncbi:hypothetical protein SASPL_148026 [Salvia splendens]|uniref:VTT domain-containing protein n=1 Tax=Salvia splendens TaxID=180675 RepID=A0A8X8W9W2_SALSN|nr:hypothetical protein SASPL_148026 [Salvia splendens]